MTYRSIIIHCVLSIQSHDVQKYTLCNEHTKPQKVLYFLRMSSLSMCLRVCKSLASVDLPIAYNTHPAIAAFSVQNMYLQAPFAPSPLSIQSHEEYRSIIIHLH